MEQIYDLTLDASLHAVVLSISVRFLRRQPRSKLDSLARTTLPAAIWRALAGAVALVATLILAGLWLLDFPSVATTPRQPVTTFFDLLKLTFAVTAGVGAVVALVVAYRKQQGAEVQLFTERFTRAAEQLGHGGAAVRLAGVYAMASLADDAEFREQRQSCIDVLCAYLRIPFDPSEPTDEVARSQWNAERQVRQSITRVICEHLQENSRVSWSRHNFDFSGAVFAGTETDGNDFGNALFVGDSVSFRLRPSAAATSISGTPVSTASMSPSRAPDSPAATSTSHSHTSAAMRSTSTGPVSRAGGCHSMELSSIYCRNLTRAARLSPHMSFGTSRPLCLSAQKVRTDTILSKLQR